MSKGMEQGIFWRQGALRVTQLRRHGKNKEACLLEAHMCGGVWTPGRLKDSGYVFAAEDEPQAMCSVCGLCTASVEHQTYDCRGTQAVLGVDFADSKHDGQFARSVVDTAKTDLEGERRFEVLWTRGLVPLHFLPVINLSLIHI